MYLSEDRRLWPFWRAEAQTPQRRVSRCASEAAWWGEGRKGGAREEPGASQSPKGPQGCRASHEGRPQAVGGRSKQQF